METTDKRYLWFKALAILGQFAALLPFAVFFETLCLEKLELWHFAAIYAVFAVFRAVGWLIGFGMSSLQKRRLPKKLVPLTNFASGIGFVVPTAAFIAMSMWLKPDFAVFFYILPAAIIIYFGGNLSVGRSYSDIFTRGWFVLNLTSSILVTTVLAVSEETEVTSAARFLLCAGFAAVALLSAVLANQTNIDYRTSQRDGGKAVLPEGLRRYNALLVIGIVGLTMGLFVFAKPLAALLRSVITAVVSGVLYAVNAVLDWIFRMSNDTDSVGDTNLVPPLVEPTNGSGIWNVIFALFLIAAVVLMIVFRKAIWGAIKSLLEPLFRSRDKTFDRPFADEIISGHSKQASLRARRKAERELSRRYASETSPERKYRLGYALFLARLNRTPYPPAPSDTTDVLREKGEKAFGEDLREFSETYSKVRYGDLSPTVEELAAEEALLKRLKSVN